MFRKNTAHRQPSLFGFAGQLPASKLKKLQSSKEYEFYRTVFCQIKEEDFSVLYCDASSRPNAPVNSLVAAIILMHNNKWTIEQLFDRMDFDLLTRTALGLDTLEETPFCPATFFNFQNRLLGHYVKAGQNLLETVFDGLTAEQLKALNIKADIQRSDSFMAMSNIRSYSRTQLLIEVLIRLHRILSDEDKKRFAEVLEPYIKQSSGQYIYGLERSSIPNELEKLGKLYHTLYAALKQSYQGFEVFGIFERVFNEHFTITADKVEVKPSEQLNGGTLQSPDDIDACYRKKNGRHFRGQSVNVTETANPDNELNLITDVAVCPNNTDDSTILNERIEHIKEKTEELNELHTDGAYGSEDNDRKMEKMGITHVQTAVRGRKTEVSMQIEESGQGQYTVSCPHQSVQSQKTRKHYKACFDVKICKGCTLKEGCPAIERADKRTYYFDRSDYLLCRRMRNIKDLPPERRKLRANVEATVKEFCKLFNHKGKLPVRGMFRTMVYALSMAVGINFGRIWRYKAENLQAFTLLMKLFGILRVLFACDNRKGQGNLILADKIYCWPPKQRYFAPAA